MPAILGPCHQHAERSRRMLGPRRPHAAHGRAMLGPPSDGESVYKNIPCARNLVLNLIAILQPYVLFMSLLLSDEPLSSFSSHVSTVTQPQALLEPTHSQNSQFSSGSHPLALSQGVVNLPTLNDRSFFSEVHQSYLPSGPSHETQLPLSSVSSYQVPPCPSITGSQLPPNQMGLGRMSGPHVPSYFSTTGPHHMPSSPLQNTTEPPRPVGTIGSYTLRQTSYQSPSSTTAAGHVKITESSSATDKSRALAHRGPVDGEQFETS